MSARIPRVGEILHCEDGSAVVVEPGTSPIDGLLSLLEEQYGGSRFSPDNPAIVAVLPRVLIRTWFSCSKAYREEHCDDYCDDWWSEDGDGKRHITVAWFDGNAYDVGDDAQDAEASAVRSETGE